MRIAAIAATLLALASCTTPTTTSSSPYQQPNSLMGDEITRRVEQIPYQHRDELLLNLQWLVQTGEQTIPAMITGLKHENPKVRSSCAWVLGQLKDRRTIPQLQEAMGDAEPAVKLEIARTLVIMGDLTWSPTLIEGLDSERKEVRFLCHEALKGSTGHDFGYDHLNQNARDLRLSVLRWRQWWGEYSGDQQFAANYQRQHDLQPQVAAPGGETRPMPMPEATPPAPTPNSDANGANGGSSQRSGSGNPVESGSSAPANAPTTTGGGASSNG